MHVKQRSIGNGKHSARAKTYPLTSPISSSSSSYDASGLQNNDLQYLHDACSLMHAARNGEQLGLRLRRLQRLRQQAFGLVRTARTVRCPVKNMAGNRSSGVTHMIASLIAGLPKA